MVHLDIKLGRGYGLAIILGHRLLSDAHMGFYLRVSGLFRGRTDWRSTATFWNNYWIHSSVDVICDLANRLDSGSSLTRQVSEVLFWAWHVI